MCKNTARDETMLPFITRARLLEVGGVQVGGVWGGIMGRAAVHPFALYPQSKHDKWEPSLA